MAKSRFGASISFKLIAGYLGMIAFMVAIAATGYLNLHGIMDMLEDMFAVKLPSIDFLDQSDRDFQQLLVAERSLLVLEPASQAAKDQIADYEENAAQATERIDSFIALVGSSEQERALYDSHRAARAKWESVSRRVVELAGSSDPARRAEAVSLSFGAAAEGFGEMREFINQLEEIVLEKAGEEQALAESVFARSVMLLLSISLATVIVALLIGLLLSRSIRVSLVSAMAFADRIAEGDLSRGIGERMLSRPDEFGRLARSLDTMNRRLSEVVSSIDGAAIGIDDEAGQVSASAQSVSGGAAEQAASVEELSSSMEEMVSNIRQNADNATETGRIASGSAQEGAKGGDSVLQTVSAMKEISSKIAIIEEIARQTNLLALNAAIEAARAGEAGRGFAVVASEVRKLAERSQRSAGEITELSSHSVAVAEEAGQIIGRIVPDIRKTNELVQEIVASNREQESGASQINSAVLQLDQVIQQNASAAEELSAMADNLASQARTLRDTVAFFNLGDKAAAESGVKGRGASGGSAKREAPKGPVSGSADRPVRKSEGARFGGLGVAVKEAPKSLGIVPAPSADGDAADSDFEEF